MKVDHVLPERSSLTLGRRITRRLSLVARVPNLIPVKWRAEALDVAEIGGNMRLWSQQLRRARPVTINVILPNGVERTVSLSYSFATFTCFISCLFLSLFLFYSFIYLLIFFNTASDLIFFLEKIFIIIWIFVLVCSSHDWWFNWFFVFLRFRFWDGSFRFISRFPPNPARKIKKKKWVVFVIFFFANFVRLLVIGSADCRSPVFPSNFWVRIRSVATEFRSRKEGYQIYFSTGIFSESIAPIYRLYLKIDWFDLLSMFDLGADFIVWFRSTFLGLIRFDGDSSHRVFGYWHSVSHSEIGLNRIELSWWIDPSIYYHWFVVEAGRVSMAEMRPLFQIFRVSCGGLAVAALLSRVWYERRGESEQADWADWAEWVEWSRWMAECRASE